MEAVYPRSAAVAAVDGTAAAAEEDLVKDGDLARWDHRRNTTNRAHCPDPAARHQTL